MKTKILFCSDLHCDLNYTFEIISTAKNNNVDIIAICGDITNFGTQKEIDIMLHNLDCGIDVVFIAGNHCQDMSSTKFRRKVAKLSNFHYLQNEYLELKGIKFYGMPHSLRFRNWWFMCDEKDFLEYLPKESVDVIIAHQPPSHPKLSMCDNAFGQCDIGSVEVLKYLEQTDTKYYFCGHNHEQGGNYAKIGNCDVYNVARSIKIIEIDAEELKYEKLNKARELAKTKGLIK